MSNVVLLLAREFLCTVQGNFIFEEEKYQEIKSRRKYGNEIWIFLQLSCSYSNESTIFNVSEYLHFELNSHERSYSRYSPE